MYVISTKCLHNTLQHVMISFLKVPLHKNKLIEFTREKTSRLNVDARSYSCDEANNRKKSTCIKRFISERIGCSPPWYPYEVKGDLKICQGSLQGYKDIAWTLKTNATFRSKSGCWRENCAQSRWQVKEKNTFESYGNYTTILARSTPVSIPTAKEKWN